MKSRKIFYGAAIALIFFLTGCATRGYHSSAGLPPGIPEEPFARPLNGQILLPFAAREDGVSTKGIVIRAREGETVRAARGGEVAYVDASLPGYGKTLILRHSEHFSTVYARCAEILVKPGQRVRKGDAIARAGHAGRDGTAAIYFEIRKNSRPEDPTHYF